MRLRRGPASKAPFRLLSLLFQYPSPELVAALPELRAAIAGLPAEPRRALDAFCAHLASRPLLALQQEYVSTFDLQKGTSLYLTYYAEGDTRKRGMALLRLKGAYARARLRLDTVELPDFLPVVLEFAELEPEAGAKLLREQRAGLEMLRLTLRERQSPYAAVVDALLGWLPPLSVPDREAVARFLQDGAPAEAVGLEPFAPPDVMPAMEARR